MAYFSHLAPLVLLFFTKKQSQKGGGCIAQLHPLNTLVASVGRSFAFYFDNSEPRAPLVSGPPGDDPFCPPLSVCLSVVKECNLKRHYESRHEAKYDSIRGQEIVYCQKAKNYCLNSYANYVLIGI